MVSQYLAKWWQRIVIIGLILLVIPLTIAASARLIGYHVLIVSSGSMGFAVPVGSLAICENVNKKEIMIGDIVLVHVKESVSLPYLHRVVDLKSIGRRIRVQTKGDANNSIDPGFYTLPSSVSREVLALPLMGFLVQYLFSRAVLLFVAVVMPTWWLGRFMYKKWLYPEDASAT